MEKIGTSRRGPFAAGHEVPDPSDGPEIGHFTFPKPLVKVPVAHGFTSEGRSCHSGTLNKGVDFNKEGGDLWMQLHNRKL